MPGTTGADAWLARAIKEAPDPSWHAAALGVSGAVANDRGRTAEAIGLLTRSAVEAATLDKPRLTGWAYTFLGRTHLLREELPEARAALDQGVEAVRAAGWMTFIAYPQSLLGAVDFAEGRIEEASDAFDSAFALGCQIGDPCWEGLGARGVGLVKIANGNVAEGIRWLDDARTRCIRIPDAYLWIHGYCLDTLCDQAIAQGVAGADRWVSDSGSGRRPDGDERAARARPAAPRCAGCAWRTRVSVCLRRTHRQPRRAAPSGGDRARRSLTYRTPRRGD